jgi:hypothetical protein
MLPAQVAAPSALRAAPAPATTRILPQTDIAAAPSRLPVRLGLGLVGSVAGLFGGALIGAGVGPLEDCHGCEDPGMKEVVAGAVIGSALGAALLAALPRSPEACRYSARFLRGLLGSALGVAVGLRAEGNTNLVTVPLGALVGAALGAESCAWQRHN